MAPINVSAKPTTITPNCPTIIGNPNFNIDFMCFLYTLNLIIQILFLQLQDGDPTDTTYPNYQ